MVFENRYSQDLQRWTLISFLRLPFAFAVHLIPVDFSENKSPLLPSTPLFVLVNEKGKVGARKPNQRHGNPIFLASS